ncbi:MAG: hypothetical protein ABS951_14345 [Solibacillus sp.]
MIESKSMQNISAEELVTLISERVIEGIIDYLSNNTVNSDINLNYYIEDDEFELAYKNDPTEREDFWKWSKDEDGWRVEIISELFIEALSNSDQEASNKFVEDFKRAIKADAIVGLQVVSLEGIIKKNSPEVIKWKEESGLFYNLEDYEETLDKEMKNLECDEDRREDALKKLRIAEKNIEFHLPKFLTPFGAFILVNSSPLTQKTVNDLFGNTDQIKLSWIKDAYPNIEKENKSSKVVVKNQISTYNFLQLLKQKQLNSSGINTSVNLYLFNKYTSLFDVWMLSKLTMKYANLNKLTKMPKLKQYVKVNKKVRFQMKVELCKRVAKVTNIKGVLLKRLLVKQFLNKPLLFEEKFLEDMEGFLDDATEGLKEYILKNISNNEMYMDIPEDIREDYIIYEQLKDVNPYNQLINNKMNKEFTSEFPITNTKKASFYEYYLYFHLAIYAVNKEAREKFDIEKT